MAGTVVTILLVPQSLAYAMLAGLPPHIGMYASILPLVAYAVLGSSMTLSVGPVAVASLMTAAAVTPLAAAGSAEYVLLSMLLALIGGVVLLLLGLLRMGFVANFLSHPVISGFVTGSAVLIAINQLKPLLGVPAEGETAFELLLSLVSRAAQLHMPTTLVGILSVLALGASRRFLAPGLRLTGVEAKNAEIFAKLAPGAPSPVYIIEVDVAQACYCRGIGPRLLPLPSGVLGSGPIGGKESLVAFGVGHRVVWFTILRGYAYLSHRSRLNRRATCCLRRAGGQPSATGPCRDSPASRPSRTWGSNGFTR